MRVDLRRFEALMSEQFLNVPEGSAVPEQMRRAAMPESVNRRIEFGGFGVILDDLPTLEVIRKMALALEVTADELVFDKAERQPQMLDKELLKNWEKIDELPDDDKLAVKKIVAALLVKHSVELAVR